MRRLMGLFGLLLMLAGCGIPWDVPHTPVGSVEPARPQTPIPTKPLEVVWSFDPASFTCVSPVPEVMDWLRANGNHELAESEVVMVKVGEGNRPGSDWWVVAAVSAELGHDMDGNWYNTWYNISWLTDLSPAPGAMSQWISLYGDIGAKWGYVDWEGELLARGQAAQTRALSCLPIHAVPTVGVTR